MSNQPPEYTRQYNFENFQALNPTTPLPGNKVEAELNAARSSINQTISRLNEIQNADGSLKTPGALAAETTATATSVATSVATSTAQAYLAANYDPTVAIQAAASASYASAMASDAAQYKQLAEANMVNAEAAASLAQNAAIDSAIARSESRSHAIDANESRNEAHASAQAAAASYADVGQVYGSALSLKNWIDSQAYQFVHKREETTHIAANMLFNDGDANNTLIGKIFQGAEMDANSKVTYPGPINNSGYNFAKGPWWVVGNPAPENPEKIIMRDMMNCLVHTWLAFGPSVASGEMKPMQAGVNGQPNDQNKSYDFMGKLIKPVIYTQQDFNTQINSPISRDSALTPKGYVDQKIALVTSMAQQADSTASIARDEVQQFRTQEYDNSRVYGPHEIVKFGDKLYWFNDFIGAAGYAPNTHPAAWTELSPQVDVSGFATENFVTSQGYLTAVPSGYATENFVTTQGYLTSIPAGYATESWVDGQNFVRRDSNGSITTTNFGEFKSLIGMQSYGSFSYPPNPEYNTPGKIGSSAFYIRSNANNASKPQFIMEHNATVSPLDGVGYPLPSYVDSFSFAVTESGISHNFSSLSTNRGISLSANGITVGGSNEDNGPYSFLFTADPSGLYTNLNGNFTGFYNGGLHLNGGIQTSAFNWSSLNQLLVANPSAVRGSIGAAAKAGDTFTGKINTLAPTNTTAGINIGTIDSTANLTNSVAGDVWIGTWQMAYKTANGTLVYGAATNASNVFGSPQVIDTTSNTMPALRVTQKGTQPSLVVEDSLNPDTTAFVVDTAGNVGIGVAANYTSTSKLEVVGNVKATTLSTGTGPTFSLNSTAAHSGGSDTLDAIVTINGVNYRIGLRPA